MTRTRSLSPTSPFLFLSKESPPACLELGLAHLFELASETVPMGHAIDEPILGLEAGQGMELVVVMLRVAFQGPFPLLQALLLHQHLLLQPPVLLGGQGVVGQQVLAVGLLELGQSVLGSLGDAQHVC